MQLIVKNMKQTYKSITFIIFCFVVLFDFAIQFHAGELDLLKPPSPDQDYYGQVQVATDYEEMAYGYNQLLRIKSHQSIDAYPVGIYKAKKLSDQDLNDLQAFVSQMVPSGRIQEPSDIAIDIETYHSFIKDLDRSVGGATILGSTFYNPSRVMTYEEALEEYEVLIQGNYSNAFARYASDYLGITAALFIPFLSAFLLMKDKRTQTEDLIFSSPVSPARYIFTKFWALVLCIMSLYMAIALFETGLFMGLSYKYDLSFNVLAFVSHMVVWILPTVMMVTAVPMLVSVVFSNGIIATVSQFLVSFFMLTQVPLEGKTGWWHLFLRFNGLGDYDHYETLRRGFLANRLGLSLAALLVVVGVSRVWKIKRDQLFMKGISHDNTCKASS